jgi:hypothetical protein
MAPTLTADSHLIGYCKTGTATPRWLPLPHLTSLAESRVLDPKFSPPKAV